MGNEILAFGEVMMRLEVPNFKKLEQSRTLDYLFSGTSVNVLSALGKYGHHTRLITKLPSNSLGDAAASYLQSLGINTSSIIRGGEFLGMYFLEQGFGLRPSKVTYSNRRESAFCQSTIDEYPYDQLFQDVSLVHFCGISLAVTENVRHTVIELATEAKRRGITVSFDCNYRPKLWESYEIAKPLYEKMLALVDICFMTEKDAKYILGMNSRETTRKDQLETLLPKVMETYKIHTIAGTIRDIISIGKHELTGYIIKNGTIHYSKTHRFQVLDRVGCGDAFASGILHGFIENMEEKQTVELAAAASALAHTTYGDSPISTIEEIQQALETNQIELER